MIKLWTLPFPSSGATDTSLEMRLGRECAVVFPNPISGKSSLSLIFDRVQAFKCTYLSAITPLPGTYDTLVDLGDSEWLRLIRTRLESHRKETSALRHLRIDFDDGPSYEFICETFRIEEPAREPGR